MRSSTKSISLRGVLLENPAPMDAPLGVILALRETGVAAFSPSFSGTVSFASRSMLYVLLSSFVLGAP